MTGRAKPRKWIAAEMARLDPHEDYARIWELSSTYHVNDFLMDWVYAITFPRFLVTVRGANAVLRGGTGKIHSEPNRRMDHTSRHMLVWWANGPEDEATQRSVASLNRLHRHWARQYPGHFGFNEDYVYTLCYEAAMMHRLRLSLGMRGFDEPLQIAAWEFWSRMATLFVNVGSEDDSPLAGFPEDFDGINAYMDWYEGQRWPRNPLGDDVADVVLRPFVERYFPKVLQPLATQLVTSLYPDFVFEAHGISRPHPLVRRLVRTGFRLGLLVSEKVVADPVESLPDLHRRRKAETGRTRPPSRNETHGEMPPVAGGCPMHPATPQAEASRALDDVTAS